MASLDDIGGSLPVLSGFPRPDWHAVASWVDSHCSEDSRSDVWTDLTRQWLARLRDSAGNGYEIFESESFLFLTSAGRKDAANLVGVAERTLREILEGLPGIAEKRDDGKFVCLAFGDRDAYYDYISPFFPEGEFGASGGMYLLAGYPHFVLNHAEYSSLEFVLVHELTHACLGGTDLPLWLEEGVTQLMEEAILGHSGFVMNRKELSRHQKYWRGNGLRCFWFGQSFGRPDEGMELSYVLAQVLTRNLLARGREDFVRFLKESEPLDCGDSAARVVYGFGIDELAAQFLGSGNWGAEPREGIELFWRANLLQRAAKYGEALADYRVVVEKGPEDAEQLNHIAWLLSTCPDDGVRDGGEAVRLATRACELTNWESEAIVDTLAAAYAECGDFEQAVDWARRAVELADEDDRSDDESRLRLYAQGKPYREP